MKTLKDALTVYRELSLIDRITFYATLSSNLDTNKETIQDLLIETRFAEEKKCAHCGSEHFVKNGKRSDGVQRFLCRDCKKSFVITTNTITSGTRKRLSIWKKYFKCMAEKKTLKETAAECEMSMGTAFAWRHKILDALENMSGNVCIGGVVQADETFFNVSYKGNHKNSKTFEMPRKAHMRGNSVHTKGLSEEKVCVVCAVNESGVPVSKAGKLGKVSSSCVEEVLKGRILPETVLCTEQERAYVKFTQNNNITLIQMDTDKRTKGEYNVQRINAYHSKLKSFIAGFKGVSTKYINNYITWHNLIMCSDRSSEETEQLMMGVCLTEPKHIRSIDISRRSPLPFTL